MIEGPTGEQEAGSGVQGWVGQGAERPCLQKSQSAKDIRALSPQLSTLPGMFMHNLHHANSDYSSCTHSQTRKSHINGMITPLLQIRREKQTCYKVLEIKFLDMDWIKLDLQIKKVSPECN